MKITKLDILVVQSRIHLYKSTQLNVCTILADVTKFSFCYCNWSIKPYDERKLLYFYLYD